MRTVKNLLILVFCAFLLQTQAFANDGFAEKTITKSFKAERGYTLDVDTKYTNINVQTHDKNEIYFDIKIKVKSRSSKTSEEEVLSKINVELNQSGKTVYAKTSFENITCNNCEWRIVYEILVPKGINYTIIDKYGNIILPDVEGNVSIIMAYGNLNAKNFSGETNNFDLKYGNLNAENFFGKNNIFDLKYGNMKTGDINGKKRIDIKYGNITVGNLPGTAVIDSKYSSNIRILKAGTLTVNMKYSNCKIDEVDELNIESGYGKIFIDKVNNISAISKYDKYTIENISKISGSFAYTHVSIDNLHNQLNISDIRYGSLNIENVLPTLSEIDFDGNRTNVSIAFDPKTAYELDAVTRYAGISVFDSENLKKTEPYRNMTQVTGTVGSAPKAKVKIKNDYGAIKLKINK